MLIVTARATGCGALTSCSQPGTLAGIYFRLVHPIVERLPRAADLGCNRTVLRLKSRNRLDETDLEAMFAKSGASVGEGHTEPHATEGSATAIQLKRSPGESKTAPQRPARIPAFAGLPPRAAEAVT